MNSVLDDYSLKISTVRKQERAGNKTSYYKLEQRNNIAEIIGYRMKRSLTLYDDQKMFRKPDNYIYSHLTSKDT